MPTIVPDVSPKIYARTAGIMYLLLIIVGVFSVMFVRGELIVSGDPVKTAKNVMDNELLWRTGIVADLFMHVLDIPIMLIIYVLLRPVNKNLALLVLLFNLVQTAVLVANKLNLIAALLHLKAREYSIDIPPNQIYSQMYSSLRLHDYGFSVGLVFFSFVCFIEGYLIRKSTYIPAIIGVLMQIAGICYFINSFTLLLFPALEKQIFAIMMIPCFIAELSFSLWLIFKGVNAQKWDAIASAV